jgi:Fe-S cluster assembly protein SufD
MAAFIAQGMPTTRDENWRYANLRTLEHVRFAPPIEAAPAVAPAALPGKITGYSRYVFVDGVFAPELSDTIGARAEFTIRSLRSHDGAAPAKPAPEAEQSLPGLTDTRFALLNEAFATDGARIAAAPGAAGPACIEIVFVASADAEIGASYPRLELQVEPHARVNLIERYMSIGSEANFVNGAVNVTVGAEASVNHYRLQQLGAQATAIDTLDATIAAAAVYRLYSVNLGAQSARSTLQIRLAGERAELILQAVSVADGLQVHDTFAVVEHAAANTRTTENFRGIAGGEARVAFNGKIVVRAGAQGTDSRQSLHGLLAGPQAEIDVRPQLEIYTDDVRCSHGATAGKLDDDMLFYLLSRGLEPETAQRLLKWAFLADVVAKIEAPELRRQIEQSLPGRIEEIMATEALVR